MGASQVKEKLYQSIENSDERTVAHILKEHPQLLNSPITDDCQSTALTRSVWRNDKKLTNLLLGMGCRVNYSGPRGITPLMWAAKRGHLEMAEFLIENGADLMEKSGDALQLTSLEMAIIMGQYEMCTYLLSLNLEQLQTLKSADAYREAAKGKYLGYADYELFLDHLKARIPFDSCPNFFQQPKKPELVDPVIDPRESWGQFLKRNIEFEEPPLVERSDLPPKLQPQNRFFGKMRQYLNGKSPFPSQITEHNEEKKQIELQNPFMGKKEEGKDVKIQDVSEVNFIEQQTNSKTSEKPTILSA